MNTVFALTITLSCFHKTNETLGDTKVRKVITIGNEFCKICVTLFYRDTINIFYCTMLY